MTCRTEEGIVESLNELGPELGCTLELIHHPTEAFMLEYCKFLLKIVYGFEVYQITERQKQEPFPELMMGVYELMNVFRLTKAFIEKLPGIKFGSFRILDITQPTRKRCLAILQASVNYILFAHTLQMDVIEPYQGKLEQQRHEMNELDRQHREIEDKIEEQTKKINETKCETEQLRLEDDADSETPEILLYKFNEVVKNGEKLSSELQNIEKQVLEIEEKIKRYIAGTEEFQSMIYDDMSNIRERLDRLKIEKEKYEQHLTIAKKSLNEKKSDNKKYIDLESQFKRLMATCKLALKISEDNQILKVMKKNLEEEINKFNSILPQRTRNTKKKMGKLQNKLEQLHSDLEDIKGRKTLLAKEMIDSESTLAETKENCIRREQQLNERRQELQNEFDTKYNEFEAIREYLASVMSDCSKRSRKY